MNSTSSPGLRKIPEVYARVKPLLPWQNLKYYKCGWMATKAAL
jgi:hypothetical protein